MNISAQNLTFKELNEQIRTALCDACINHCNGQRFIGCGLSGKTVTINGTPGNALGAYLDGATLIVNGNAQDAVGDTMNSGTIMVYGNAGDALGYAMRGGKILIKGDAGYRTGIHMKEYNGQKPVIVVGGKVGSFLGEYLAGGLIVVLGIGSDDIPIGHFAGTGMHGGRILVRTEKRPVHLPKQVMAEIPTGEEMQEIMPYIKDYAACFGMSTAALLESQYYVLKPNARNPYRQLYTAN